MKVTNAAFNIQSTVGSISGPLSSLIPTHEAIMKKIQHEFIGPMGNGNTKEATTQACGMGTGTSRGSVDLHIPYLEPLNRRYADPSPLRPDPFWYIHLFNLEKSLCVLYQ